MSFADLIFGLELIRLVQGLWAPQFTELFIVISLLGSETLLVGVASIVYWCFDKRHGKLLTYVLLFGAYLNFFLKTLIPWPRPPTEFRLAEFEETSFGFPSGHMQDSTVTWSWLWITFKNRILIILGIALVFLVGLSRVYLGLHYPSQVIGGTLVGLIIVTIAASAVHRLPERGHSLTFEIMFAISTVIPFFVAIVFLGSFGDGGRVGGYLFGFAFGAIGEERVVKFSTNVVLKVRLTRIAVATLVGAATSILLETALPQISPAFIFLNAVSQGLTVAFVIPLIFKAIEHG